jgi:hypothetical protein
MLRIAWRPATSGSVSVSTFADQLLEVCGGRDRERPVGWREPRLALTAVCARVDSRCRNSILRGAAGTGNDHWNAMRCSIHAHRCKTMSSGSLSTDAEILAPTKRAVPHDAIRSGRLGLIAVDGGMRRGSRRNSFRRFAPQGSMGCLSEGFELPLRRKSVSGACA